LPAPLVGALIIMPGVAKLILSGLLSFKIS